MIRINFLISRHIEQWDEQTHGWIRIKCPGMSLNNAVELIESLKQIHPNEKFRVVNDEDEVFQR